MALPLRVGVVGCGNISDIYLKNCAAFETLTCTAVADLDADRARAKAEEHGVPRSLTPDALIDDDAVDLVLNLTPPSAHAEVAARAIAAGKHVYNEKPLATRPDDAAALLESARAAGVRVGCAPDTVLGAGTQTARAIIDEGGIGSIVGGSASFLSRGMEHWHPDPEFFFKPGGGPLLDMGPYYVHALATMLGPVARVSGASRASFPEREITSEPRRGERIVVETPTHIAALLEFESGAIVTVGFSFDVAAHRSPRIEIYGSEGTLSAPDPNTFGGPVEVCPRGGEWAERPLRGGASENSRGIGLADMARAIDEGRPHRASGEAALHALEVMSKILAAAERGEVLTIDSRPARPEQMPADFRP